MSCHEDIVDYMHDYLDEAITEENKEHLREHLHSCADCRSYFHDMKKAIALVQSTARIKAPDDFTARVMASIPKEKKNIGMKRYLRNHPLLTAASLFIVLMGGSVFSTWGEEQNFAVSKQENIVVENEMVIIPAGKVVKGDVVVKNGDIRIEGEVKGDVTIINGEQYLASAGKVTGQIVVIDEMFEWLWFKVKSTGKALFKGEENE